MERRGSDLQYCNIFIDVLRPSPGTTRIRMARHIPSAQSCRMHSVCTICPAIFGNGAVIGMVTIPSEIKSILKAPLKANIESCGVVHGGVPIPTPARRIVQPFHPRPVTKIWAFVLWQGKNKFGYQNKSPSIARRAFSLIIRSTDSYIYLRNRNARINRANALSMVR